MLKFGFGFCLPFQLSLSTKPKEIEEIGQHTAGSFQRNRFKEKEHNKIGPHKQIMCIPNM
jgi:hypothetical protein